MRPSHSLVIFFSCRPKQFAVLIYFIIIFFKVYGKMFNLNVYKSDLITILAQKMYIYNTGAAKWINLCWASSSLCELNKRCCVFIKLKLLLPLGIRLRIFINTIHKLTCNQSVLFIQNIVQTYFNRALLLFRRILYPSQFYSIIRYNLKEVRLKWELFIYYYNI